MLVYHEPPHPSLSPQIARSNLSSNLSILIHWATFFLCRLHDPDFSRSVTIHLRFVIMIRDVKSVYFPNSNFVSKIQILFELCLAYGSISLPCIVMANITKVPPTTMKDTHFRLHDSG